MLKVNFTFLFGQFYDLGSNILLDATLSLVKLADFGAAKKLNFIDKSRYDHSKKGDIVGTPYWMAPEVVRGHGCGRRSDIWSAGCTILEMLTLKPPFKHFEPLAALFHIASATSPAQIFDSGSFSPNLTVRKNKFSSLISTINSGPALFHLCSSQRASVDLFLPESFLVLSIKSKLIKNCQFIPFSL